MATWHSINSKMPIHPSLLPRRRDDTIWCLHGAYNLSLLFVLILLLPYVFVSIGRSPIIRSFQLTLFDSTGSYWNSLRLWPLHAVAHYMMRAMYPTTFFLIYHSMYSEYCNNCNHCIWCNNNIPVFIFIWIEMLVFFDNAPTWGCDTLRLSTTSKWKSAIKVLFLLLWNDIFT